MNGDHSEQDRGHDIHLLVAGPIKSFVIIG